MLETFPLIKDLLDTLKRKKIIQDFYLASAYEELTHLEEDQCWFLADQYEKRIEIALIYLETKVCEILLDRPNLLKNYNLFMQKHKSGKTKEISRSDIQRLYNMLIKSEVNLPNTKLHLVSLHSFTEILQQGRKRKRRHLDFIVCACLIMEKFGFDFWEEAYFNWDKGVAYVDNSNDSADSPIKGKFNIIGVEEQSHDYEDDFKTWKYYISNLDYSNPDNGFVRFKLLDENHSRIEMVHLTELMYSQSFMYMRFKNQLLNQRKHDNLPFLASGHGVIQGNFGNALPYLIFSISYFSEMDNEHLIYPCSAIVVAKRVNTLIPPERMMGYKRIKKLIRDDKVLNYLTHKERGRPSIGKPIQ